MLPTLLMFAVTPARAGSWTTGPVEDLVTVGLAERYTTDPLEPGYEAELRIVHGLWNSPDITLEVSFGGVYVGHVEVDPSVPWSNPGVAVFVVTDLITANQPYDIDVVATGYPAPYPPFEYGEAVIGSIDVVWDSDDDGDGVGGLTDCDDADPDQFPGAPERCNLEDDDCDGQIDAPDPIDPVTLYVDADGDGHGTAVDPILGCPGAPGTATVDDDCDDFDQTVFPGAPEDCAPVDRDCDGSSDAGAVDAVAWQPDGDGDGFGAGTDQVVACEPPPGYGAAGDCDDGLATVFPGADELCNGLDDDCDAEIDEDPIDPVPLFMDADGDGFGGTQVVLSCPGRPDTSDQGGDCNDADGATYPGAVEVCDGLDQDCDEVPDDDAVDQVPSWADADGDGFGEPGTEAPACPQAAGRADNDLDCDDTDRRVHPDAEERCNGVDDDCDGRIDVEAIDARDLFADEDHDGYGDPDRPVRACTLDAAADDATDCDDGDPNVYPSAPGLGPDCEPLDKGGCGCASGPTGAWPALLLLLGLRRRR